jgi:hypothetical protein
MRPILLLFILPFLFSCGDKPQGVNFLVTNGNKDTLSHFYYDGQKKYSIFNNTGLDTALTTDVAKSTIKGQLMFGIKDRIEFTNRFLVFKSKIENEFETFDRPHIAFLKDEYNLEATYEVVMSENYVDSLQSPFRKIETQIAIDKQTGDSILFQEVNYVMKGNDMITSFIVYDNLDSREEMRLFLDDIVKTIKTSVNQD